MFLAKTGRRFSQSAELVPQSEAARRLYRPDYTPHAGGRASAKYQGRLTLIPEASTTLLGHGELMLNFIQHFPRLATL